MLNEYELALLKKAHKHSANGNISLSAPHHRCYARRKGIGNQLQRQNNKNPHAKNPKDR